MASIDAYFEFEKENDSYKAEIKLYGFNLSGSIVKINDGPWLKRAIVYSPNKLFEKLGKKFERSLKYI